MDDYLHVTVLCFTEVEHGSWDQGGLPYECRTLLFKALHNLIERSVGKTIGFSNLLISHASSVAQPPHLGQLASSKVANPPKIHYVTIPTF